MSAIVHVFLFTSVTFVFQPLELSIKPVFVFLGQIIGREEIAQLQTSDEQSLGNRNQPAFVLKDTPVRAEWVTLRQGQKDAYAGEIIHGQKLHIKNTFLNENQDAQKWKDEFNRMGIDPDLTPWTPLRLNK